MWEMYEEMWEEQIGHRARVGFDFVGREIHKEDFGNPVSKYGWTLLPFGGEGSYLVVHNKTLEEFPEVVNGEFIINGKTFEVVESKEKGLYEINEVSYEEVEEIENNNNFDNQEANKTFINPNEEEKYENIEKYKDELAKSKIMIENEIQELRNDLHWQNVEHNNRNEENDFSEEEFFFQNHHFENHQEKDQHFINEQVNLLKSQIDFIEDKHKKEITELQNIINQEKSKAQNSKEIEMLKTLTYKFQEQERELEELKRKQKIEQDIFNEQKTIEMTLIKNLTDKFERQEAELNELKKSKQQEETIAIDINSLKKQNDLQNLEKIEFLKNLNDKFERQEAELNELKMNYKNKHVDVSNSNDDQNINNIQKSIELDLITKKLNEQEKLLNELKLEKHQQELKILNQEKQIKELGKTANIDFNSAQKHLNQTMKMKLDNFQNESYDESFSESFYNNNNASDQWNTDTFSFKNIKHEKPKINDNSNFNINSLVDNPFHAWEQKFGNKKVVYDYANQLMVKSEYGKNVEGGWGFDKYFANDESSQFISSLNSILQRGGKSSFTIDNKGYKIVNNNGIYSIVEKGEKDYSLYSKEEINNNVKNLHPQSVKKFNGKYESYASLLINLNHFPIDYLDKFDEFLANMLNELPIFKSKYIYLNKRSYESGNSNITSYARVFFKYDSFKDQIQIVMVSLALKNALIQFTNQYRSKNNRFVVSFSMVLTNHKMDFKFIQAQTNYDILRTNPVPFKIPQYKLIIDKEFNATLQFHENQMWKNIKPFALDHAGHTYYVCDINVDEYLNEMN